MMTMLLFLSVLVLMFCNGQCADTRGWKQSSSVPYNPEIYMDATQLITSKGYPCENHYVTTTDGFILNMQRIPHGVKGSVGESLSAVKPVVILQHGLLGASSSYLENLANESLPFILADAGADVWLGNVRGNKYSRAHVTLKPSDKRFWKWSWDEMARYDLPAMIDHIVQNSSQPQIYYVGHSQGTMIGFAGFSQNQTLGHLVKTFIALAPVARVGHIKSPIRMLAPFAKEIKKFFSMFGEGEFLPGKNITKSMAKDFCENVETICENFLFVISGFDSQSMNKSRVAVYTAHTPSGTSVQNILHFGQGVNSHKYQMYDHGSAAANMAHYNQSTPPTYQPSDMKVPVALFSGGKDYLADPEDVAWIRSKVKANIVHDQQIDHYEHLDFVYAYDAPLYCYQDLKQLIFT